MAQAPHKRREDGAKAAVWLGARALLESELDYTQSIEAVRVLIKSTAVVRGRFNGEKEGSG